ncbi:2-dehydro-3-deoxygalactonokinase [Dongia sp.]|uniref:2-dehydro-3-deoxygalactonokinase n=1 Tax=Dongia sp. TaxID=1977262 RepID=UPI0035B04C25
MTIRCIAVDWGTSNRRAWALDGAGRVIARRADDQGLLAIKDRAFAASLQTLLGDWMDEGAPIIMCGMVGSRLGWVEVPYLNAPVSLAELGNGLKTTSDSLPETPYIVPGIARFDAAGADVMRGEECQMLGALLTQGKRDGIFLLPGTHAKWARLEAGVLTDFRTYMTGELFAQLRKGSSLAQLMPPADAPDLFDGDAFDRGFTAAFAGDSPGITHLLFTVRSLSLFGRLTPDEAPSYLSGLLIGAEMKDALSWLKGHETVTAIGSAKLLETYDRAARIAGIPLERLESDDILPPALFSIARAAGLGDLR